MHLQLLAEFCQAGRFFPQNRLHKNLSVSMSSDSVRLAWYRQNPKTDVNVCTWQLKNVSIVSFK